jgi:hypothetical protein
LQGESAFELMVVNQIVPTIAERCSVVRP